MPPIIIRLLVNVVLLLLILNYPNIKNKEAYIFHSKLCVVCWIGSKVIRSSKVINQKSKMAHSEDNKNESI